MITAASAEWILLSVIYHYVLARSPSPEAAKLAISEARRNGQLRLRAELREHKARPHLRLEPGKLPPKIRPKRKPDQPILASDNFSSWEGLGALLRDHERRKYQIALRVYGDRWKSR